MYLGKDIDEESNDDAKTRRNLCVNVEVKDNDLTMYIRKSTLPIKDIKCIDEAHVSFEIILSKLFH